MALRPGRYDTRCADHDWTGMTGEITVKEPRLAGRK